MYDWFLVVLAPFMCQAEFDIFILYLVKDGESLEFEDHRPYEQLVHDPLPTIETIQTKDPSIYRAMSIFLLKSRKQTTFHEIIANILIDSSSLNTHEFVIHSLWSVLWFRWYHDLYATMKKITHLIGDNHNAQILFRCLFLDHYGFYQTHYFTKSENKFVRRFINIWAKSDQELSYAKLYANFAKTLASAPRGRLTKSARRDVFN